MFTKPPKSYYMTECECRNVPEAKLLLFQMNSLLLILGQITETQFFMLWSGTQQGHLLCLIRSLLPLKGQELF